MSTAPDQFQDLIGYLADKFFADVAAAQRELNIEQTETLKELIAHFRETMRTLNPQSMSYAGSGMSLRLATGHELLLSPPIDMEQSAKSVGAFPGGVSFTNRGSSGGGSTVQHGDYPLTGAKEPRHDRMTKKPG